MIDLYTRMLLPLNRTGLKFMITGSVAVIAYGEPRTTNDVDIVIDLSPDNAYKLHRAYASSDFYAPPADVMAMEAEEAEGQFNVVHLDSVMRADFYVAGNDPLHQWALQNRRMERIGGIDLPFAPLEYLIIRKLEYFRNTKSDRHLRDVAGLMRVSGEQVDHAGLHELIAERKLENEWEAAQEIVRSRPT